MEGAGGVNNCFERWGGEHSVFKCILLRNIFDDRKIKTVLPIARKDSLDLLSFALAPYSSHNGMSIPER